MFQFGIAALSLVIIMFSASYIITAASDYAKKTGVSDYLIGFLVLSIGTSLPELTTAFVASFSGAGNLVLGDVLGANIIDVTIVLGIMSIVGKKIFVHGKILTETLFTVMIMVILPFILGFDGLLSRRDGIILVVSFLVYIISLLKKEGKFGELKKQLHWKDIWQDMFIITGCVIALLLSANWLIHAARNIAYMMDIPEFIVGLVLVAVGTTVPELTVELKSVISGSTGIAFGDILGSVVTNSSLVLGIAAILNPISFERSGFINSASFMITAVFISLLFIKKKEITWQEGIGLLMIYITFILTVGIADYIT